tara:strand:+ start:7288 stop:7794 length:507 start_codon:yes stop_codon:yes gene_type:complete
MKISFKNKIGKGLFSTAYLQENNTVVLKSVDPIKECMSFGWFPESNFFPKIEHIDFELYSMKYYPKVKSLKKSLTPKHWDIYKELRKLDIGIVDNRYNYLDSWREEFKKVTNKTVKNALIEAVEACANYGSDVRFEISPRNVAVSKTGKLILLDCFFIQSKADQVRTK